MLRKHCLSYLIWEDLQIFAQQGLESARLFGWKGLLRHLVPYIRLVCAKLILTLKSAAETILSVDIHRINI